MYTPGQVSDMLNIPSSTLRRYAVIFKDYLSTGARQKRRVYNDTDLATLEKIKKLKKDGKLLDDIPKELDLVHDQIVEQVEETKANLPAVIAKVEDTANEVDQLKKVVEELLKRIEWQEQPIYKKIGKKPPE